MKQAKLVWGNPQKAWGVFMCLGGILLPISLRTMNPNVLKTLFALVTSSLSSVKFIFVGFQWNIDESIMTQRLHVRKLHHNVSFVRYFGANPFSLKHSTPVAILTITQQKSIFFTNADMVYPSIHC